MPGRSVLLLFAACTCVTQAGADDLRVRFATGDERLEVRIGDRPFATYVFRDETITRPFFCNVHTPRGVQVTRHHPPREDDLRDHDALHPGIWLAFGDLGGNDSWRLKARVEHVEFVEPPHAESSRGRFAVRNRYLTEDASRTICTEVCRYAIVVRQGEVLLMIDSTFTSDAEFAFGDQEEMGLGVRLATPIAEKSGRSGLLTDAAGRTTAKEIWGRQADWCDYSGVADGQAAGITILPDPRNFRPCWWHARDYGFVAANPFGRRASTQDEPSRVVVAAGDEFRLRFGVVIHDGRPGAGYDPQDAWRSFVALSAETK